VLCAAIKNPSFYLKLLKRLHCKVFLENITFINFLNAQVHEKSLLISLFPAKLFHSNVDTWMAQAHILHVLFSVCASLNSPQWICENCNAVKSLNAKSQ
jgi:hypothetical protein